MDTRFWGPSGWQMLHLIAHSYPDHPDIQTKRQYETFFNSMKDVLPCRFCRESTCKFMSEPEFALHPAMTSRKRLTLWLYDLHNRVNKKLRDQCSVDPNVICPPPDPSFEEVTEIYESLLKKSPSAPPGLDFLFCIAFNYPKDVTSDKIRGYFEFFTAMCRVYPYEKLRRTLCEKIDDRTVYDSLLSRQKFLHWFYGMMRAVAKECGSLDMLPSFHGISQRYGYYSSGCMKKTYRGKTCRNGKKQRDHRKTYKVTHARLLS
jgi:hypothetical protein